MNELMLWGLPRSGSRAGDNGDGGRRGFRSLDSISHQTWQAAGHLALGKTSILEEDLGMGTLRHL